MISSAVYAAHGAQRRAANRGGNDPRKTAFNEDFAALLGMVNGLTIEAGRLTRHLEDSRREDPVLWKLYEKAVEKLKSELTTSSTT
jgi:hypothetical protein